MELFVRPLSGTASAEQVLRRLAARARRLDLAPPAAVTGDWFASRAILAPSVRITPAPDPFRTLDTVPDMRERAPEAPDGAVGGGYFGYLGYGLTDPGRHVHERRLPQAAWGWADHVLRMDRHGQWWFEALCAEEPARELWATLSAVAEGGAAAEDGEGYAGEPRWESGPVVRPDADEHRKAIKGCLEEIAAGEIYQANIASRFSLPFQGSTCELFTVGSQRFSPARAAYLAGPWGAVISFSPERFLTRQGKTVHSSPIKGTLPRRGPHDDLNARLLRESAKEVAENVMIVDMARNDLGRVAEVGSVTVTRLLDVQPHPGVWHLVSDVRAELPDNLPHSGLLSATFPPASVTGAPKSRALEIIAELENQPREVYCGAIGVASPVAGLELNVAIRTLEYRDGVLHLGVGGGITADSDPDREWQECLTKAAPMLSLLRQS